MSAADRVAQGFPPHVEDPAVLARAAAIILGRGKPAGPGGVPRPVERPERERKAS